jgi:hypothetical protein
MKNGVDTGVNVMAGASTTKRETTERVTNIVFMHARLSEGLANWQEHDAAPMSSTISARFSPGPSFAPLFFVFAVFGRADEQRAIRAVSACNTPASIRPNVFGGALAFSC